MMHSEEIIKDFNEVTISRGWPEVRELTRAEKGTSENETRYNSGWEDSWGRNHFAPTQFIATTTEEKLKVV